MLKFFVWQVLSSTCVYLYSLIISTSINCNLQCIREVLLLGHRQAFAWIDDWVGMDIEDVRKYECAMQSKTNTLVQQNASGDLSPLESSPSASPLESGDMESLSNTPSAPVTPASPKSPNSAKKSLFSWF